ncbi:hypothetical protein M405DRAFT_485238 [Rhizopogon salebrosus TDB-379]|nr:hypothetical protein M405DRAFT_485238 [Rhizopogon salebrosus TDB-379]
MRNPLSLSLPCTTLAYHSPEQCLLSLPLFSSHYHDFCMRLSRIFGVQSTMVYAVDKKRYCGIQRNLRGPKRVSRYNFDLGCEIRRALPLWSTQINIHNKSNRPDSRDEHRTQRTVLDQHAGFNCMLLSTQAEGPVTQIRRRTILLHVRVLH